MLPDIPMVPQTPIQLEVDTLVGMVLPTTEIGTMTAENGERLKEREERLRESVIELLETENEIVLRRNEGSSSVNAREFILRQDGKRAVLQDFLPVSKSVHQRNVGVVVEI